MSTLYDELEAHRQNKNDKRIFGLVLQGGGMRAVYSCGAAQSLAAYGFENTFDFIVGNSAGAINGAYLMAGPRNSPIIYTKELTNKKFVNLARINKVVDIDYLVDNVLIPNYPLNVERLLKARTKLYVVLTNAQTGKKEVIANHHEFAEIYEEIRATAALPLLYDRKVKVGNTEYIDGGVSDLLPIDEAIKLGCTDLVVVLTQQLQTFKFTKRHKRLVKHLMRRFAKKQSEAVRKILPTNESVLKMNIRRLTHPTKKIRIYLLEPSDENILVSIGTIDRSKIEALAKLGIADMDAFLHKSL